MRLNLSAQDYDDFERCVKEICTMFRDYSMSTSCCIGICNDGFFINGRREIIRPWGMVLVSFRRNGAVTIESDLLNHDQGLMKILSDVRRQCNYGSAK